MSPAENDKDNKKQKEKQSTMKSVIGPLPTSDGNVFKKMRSPRSKAKKKPSLSQAEVSENASENLSEVMEATENDDDNKSTTMTLVTQDLPPPIAPSPLDITPSKLNLAKVPFTLETPPDTHYLPVPVAVYSENWTILRELLKLNSFPISRNMVIKSVPMELMSFFMAGDQIARVNKESVWNMEDFKECLQTPLEGLITVIRAWNIKCLDKDQLAQVHAVEGLQYFVTQVHGKSFKRLGVALGAKKKSIVVTKIWAQSPVGSCLLVGDQILGVADLIFTGNKRQNRKRAIERIKIELHKFGFTEIIACRGVGARSSPAPSIEAEQVLEYPAFGETRERNPMGHRKKIEGPHIRLDLPLPADALEIAFRELTFLRLLGLPDSDETSLHRGPSLLRDPPFSAETTSPEPSANGVSMFKPPFDSTKSIKQDLVELKSPDDNTPPGMEVKFKDKIHFETSNITSDIPEEDHLKKCDAKSGMVAFVKAKLNKGRDPNVHYGCPP